MYNISIEELDVVYTTKDYVAARNLAFALKTMYGDLTILLTHPFTGLTLKTLPDFRFSI